MITLSVESLACWSFRAVFGKLSAGCAAGVSVSDTDGSGLSIGDLEMVTGGLAVALGSAINGDGSGDVLAGCSPLSINIVNNFKSGCGWRSTSISCLTNVINSGR